MILHIPHASRAIPADLREQFVLDDDALKRELTRMTDAFTDELFCFAGAVRVEARISRLVVDVERFRDDKLEPMSSVGMGAVYERTSGGDPLRVPIGNDARKQLLERFYDPHHEQLERAVATQLSGRQLVQVVDCHSFPSQPLACDRDQRRDRPDFCIGTDGFHTDMDLADGIGNLLVGCGCSVGVDWPYSGAIVPLSAYQRDSRIRAVMIEVNRKLYMDESTGEKTPSFEEASEVVAKVLQLIHAYES